MRNMAASPSGRAPRHGAGGRPPGATGLAARLAFLSAHLAPEREIETHAAHVFPTRDRAWKIKKPTRLPGFDHLRLAARERACHEELRLNRQLAGPGVYLGVWPLLREPDGTYRLGADGAGEIVDWLVEMRRLPAERMLDAMIERGARPAARDLAALGQTLAAFYSARQAEPPRPGLYLAHLAHESALSRRHLAEMAPRLGVADLGHLAAAGVAAVAGAGPAIAAREAAGMVVEGHGDLRPEHICLTRPPVIFDRIEAAPALRMIDVGDELGFLAMECRLLGAPGIAARVAAELQTAGFALPPAPLARVYTLFRALTRARLAADHLRSPAPRHGPDHWIARTRRYLDEARRAADGADSSGQI